jgi:hypothetical protein
MELTYDGQPVLDLLPAAQTKKVLGPEDDVIILNRGRHTLRDRFDGRVYVIPPGRFCRIKYASAQAFQQRAVVPGTRNPLATGPSKKQTSFIAICDVDPDDQCVPFTDAFVQQYSLIDEAIDRSVMDADAQRVTKVTTNAVAASLPGAGAGGGLRPQLGGDLDALVPPEVNEAQREMAATAHEVSAMDQAAAKTRTRARHQRAEVDEA